MSKMRTLTPELFESAGELLASAFFDNPAHVYICRDQCARRAQLEWLLGGNVRLQPDLGASFCLANGSVVDAMGFWTRSDAAEVGVLRKIRAGILGAPFRLGIEGVRRLVEVTGEIDRQRDRAVGERPFWYLNNMAVRDHLRGTGVGTQLLEEQLRLVAQREPEFAIALATQRDENVRFYRRLGFEVVSDERIGHGTDSFRNWIMLHTNVDGR